ncbi:MAG: hypothetical protein J3Q66DRAFT_386577 [Benniella sp.]|nr:MAG: hypothetical protein J3Q66DRAFT_386577 [Benniella sp.]
MAAPKLQGKATLTERGSMVFFQASLKEIVNGATSVKFPTPPSIKRSETHRIKQDQKKGLNLLEDAYHDERTYKVLMLKDKTNNINGRNQLWDNLTKLGNERNPHWTTSFAPCQPKVWLWLASFQKSTDNEHYFYAKAMEESRTLKDTTTPYDSLSALRQPDRTDLQIFTLSKDRGQIKVSSSTALFPVYAGDRAFLEIRIKGIWRFMLDNMT